MKDSNINLLKNLKTGTLFEEFAMNILSQYFNDYDDISELINDHLDPFSGGVKELAYTEDCEKIYDKFSDDIHSLLISNEAPITFTNIEFSTVERFKTACVYSAWKISLENILLLLNL